MKYSFMVDPCCRELYRGITEKKGIMTDRPVLPSLHVRHMPIGNCKLGTI